MKKNILLIITIVVSIFSFFKEDVYAETYTCSYLDGFFVITYDTSGKATYVGNDVINGVNCGTEDKPCKKLLNVIQSGLGKKLKLDEWNDFFKNGSFACPRIFYSAMCYEEPLTTDQYYTTCEYEFSPYTNAPESVTNEPFVAILPDGEENDENIDTGVNVCTDAEKISFINASDQEMLKFTSAMNQFTTQINSSKNLSPDEYRKLKEQYEKSVNALMNSSVSALEKYQSVCDLGSLYTTTLNQRKEQMDSLTNKFYENFTNVVIDAQYNAVLNGQDGSSYGTVLEDIKEARVNNLKTVIAVSNELVNKYNSFLSNYIGVPLSCEGILTPELIEILNKALFYIRIAVPILLIVFGIIDFGKVIISDDKNDMKKAGSKFLKRCIIGVVIFLVPTIIGFLIDIFNLVSGESITNAINCGIK